MNIDVIDTAAVVPVNYRLYRQCLLRFVPPVAAFHHRHRIVFLLAQLEQRVDHIFQAIFNYDVYELYIYVFTIVQLVQLFPNTD